jgi:Ca-activated chloride channel family protein
MSPGDFSFLRPGWLLALLALPLLALLAGRIARRAEDWRRAIDPHLLPHLLDRGTRRRNAGAWLSAAAFVIAVLALAGPSWRSRPQPLWQTRVPTVIAADLSSASLAADLPPSRLAQMRARIAQRLQRHPGGPIALVAYAGDAFTVTPLTEDVANIELFLDALQPDIMPVDGQAADRAIAWSRELMRRGGYERGHIVLMTDRVDAAAQRAAAAARGAGYTVSTIGLGTLRGADVQTSGGAQARVALDEGALRGLARAGGGRYARLGDGDERAFVAPGQGGVAGGQGRAAVRQDDGYWLIPPLMLLVLLAWLRPARPAVAVLVLAFVAWPMRAPAADAWRRPDQKAHADIVDGVEAYRRGDYDRAAALFSRSDAAVAHYNRGNALARDGRLEEAVEAYDEALRRAPSMSDAVANRATVLRALQRQGTGEGDESNDRRGGASDRGDSQSRRRPRNDGDGASRGGQGRQQQAPPDPAAQARADAAQRQRMESAMQRSRAEQAQARAQGRQPQESQRSAEQRERQLSNDAALRRIPDEPGSLLREKFRLEHARRQREGGWE